MGRISYYWAHSSLISSDPNQQWHQFISVLVLFLVVCLVLVNARGTHTHTYTHTHCSCRSVDNFPKLYHSTWNICICKTHSANSTTTRWYEALLDSTYISSLISLSHSQRGSTYPQARFLQISSVIQYFMTTYLACRHSHLLELLPRSFPSLTPFNLHTCTPAHIWANGLQKQSSQKIIIIFILGPTSYISTLTH